MRARLLELAARRARLLERAAAERETLAAWLGRAEAVSDRVSAWAAAARRLCEAALSRPLAIAAAVAMLVALRPRRALRLAMLGWSLWRLYGRARRWWGFLGSRNAA